MQRWRAHRDAPIAATVERLETLRGGGQHTFVFTNGTDTVPAELQLRSLTRLFDAVLNSAGLGVAKPDPAAYAAAHGAIERHLGRTVPPEQVWFTDDSVVNVRGASEFAWTAVVFSQDDRSRMLSP